MSQSKIFSLVANGHWLVRTSTGEYLDVVHDERTGEPRLTTVPVSRVRHAFSLTRVADSTTRKWHVVLESVPLAEASGTGAGGSRARRGGKPAKTAKGRVTSGGAAAVAARGKGSAGGAAMLQLPMLVTHHGCLDFEVAPLSPRVASSLAATAPSTAHGAMAMRSLLATVPKPDFSLSLKVDLPHIASMKSGIPFPEFKGAEKNACDYIATKLKIKDIRSDALNSGSLRSVAKPATIGLVPWESVVRQLELEIGCRTDIDLLFRPLREFIQNVFIDQSGLVETVGDHITLAGNETVNILAHQLLRGVAGAVGKLDFTGSGLVAAALQGGVDLLMADRSLSAEDFAVAKANARDSMSKLFQSLLTAVQRARQHVVSDWGLLQATAEAIRASDEGWRWPTDDGDLRAAARQSLELQLWKMMLKLKWHHLTPSDDPAIFKSFGEGDKNAYEASNPHYWLEYGPGSKPNPVSGTSTGILVRYHWLGYGCVAPFSHEPSRAMCERLFTTLKVSKQEVFTSPEWGLTRETFIVPNYSGFGM